MPASIIDGAAVAAGIRQRLALEVAEFSAQTGRVPGLATVLVGEDAASQVYVANKRRLATAVGIADLHRQLPADSTSGEVAAVLAELAVGPAVSGILLQLPLPRHLSAAPLIDLIPPHKDVDGLTTASAGLLARGESGLRPCTPSGVIELLDSAGVELDGALAVVIGRSELVGAPMAQLLMRRHATVVLAHSHTRDLASITRQADILVAAAGVPGLIGVEHVKRGAAVIDVGIHRTPAGLVGDARFDEVVERAGWITPVPGGVGPMTIAMLLVNTVIAERRRAAY